ncbi:hypothetical protein HDU87_002958 [Geranomyces variabilis]|uniref:glutathione gamma-glutamylcysteinyltransferase n=1 Tax=Geranomyces variabilis TaxID=109894 RepID=A0AAD5TL94_9FUNG|nr:hypothetical protein HDU87_002958 [Geranomyces variabilis]
MLSSPRPVCSAAARHFLNARRRVPPAATVIGASPRVVCTAAVQKQYASLAPHPCPAASAFSSSLPYAHCPRPPTPSFQQQTLSPSQQPQPEQHKLHSTQPTAEAVTASSAQQQQTFYRRELPKNLHSFTSKTGRALFKECVASGNAEIYFSLSGNFTMQSEPAFCGLGSLAMVLNALTVDPGRRWKGVWRWYSDEMLECTHTPREQVREKGMTFAELACLARCNGLRVVARRADTVTREQFFEDLKRVSASEDVHMVVSFSRKTLGQTGDGHFSPIGAYHPGKNQVLICDTARFKYPSYFVDGNLLYDSLGEIDAVTGLPRGYFILTKGEAKPLSLCRISVGELGEHGSADWTRLAQLFTRDLPDAFRLFPAYPADDSNDSAVGTGATTATASVTDDSITAVLRQILSALPTASPFIISLQPPGVDLASATQSLAESHETDVLSLLSAARSTPLYPHVLAALGHPDLRDAFPSPPPSSSSSLSTSHTPAAPTTPALATIFLLAAPTALFASLPRELRRAFEDFRARHSLPALLAGEVTRLAEQMDVLLNSFCKCGAGPPHRGH